MQRKRHSVICANATKLIKEKGRSGNIGGLVLCCSHKITGLLAIHKELYCPIRVVIIPQIHHKGILKFRRALHKKVLSLYRLLWIAPVELILRGSRSGICSSAINGIAVIYAHLEI